jgi:hypothetical protein
MRLEHAREYYARLTGRDENAFRAPLSVQQRRDLDAWETFYTLAALTQEFNNEAAALEGPPDISLRENSGIDNLFVDPDTGRFNDEARLRGMRAAPHWCQFFGIADTLAQQRQEQFKFDWMLVFGLTVLAVLFFAVAGHGGELTFNLSLAAYTVVVAIIYLLIMRARNKRDQERFLDYRALAEALRVTVYWKILGIDGDEPSRAILASKISVTTDTPVNYYPIKQPSELAWIKICLRTIDLCYHKEAETGGAGMDSESHRIARRFWVYGQLIYFQRQGNEYNRRAEFLESWTKVIFFTTPFFLIPFILSALGQSEFMGVKPHEVFLAALGLLPGVAAVLSSYAERLGLTAQARQYDRMRMLFKRAYDLLPETLDAPTARLARSLYRELGIEALKESADWVAIYRQRPIAPVQ